MVHQKHVFSAAPVHQRPSLQLPRAGRKLAVVTKAQQTQTQARDLTSIEKRPAAGLQQVQEVVLSPFTAVPVAAGIGGAIALGYGTDGALAGAVVGAALRAVQLLLLDQTVPFTLRRHTLLLPVGIELLMGDATFKQQLAGFQQKGKLLPSSSREYKMINQIAERVIEAVRQQNGGGFQKHTDRFNWEVVVVDDKVPNAFVLPGGKIVVFTGLIKVMENREDLLAAVIGHEVAHALARHSSEKLSLGLFVTLVANLGLAAVNYYLRNQQEQQGRGGRGGPQRGAGGWPQGGPVRGIPVGGVPGRGGPFGASAYGRGRGGFGGRGGGLGGFGGVGGSPLLNPQVISIFTNLFLQLPFSRRAEAEADLIA
jgi:Zn-dependent protease with chaperone function